MKKLHIYRLLVIIAIVVSSCQKEVSVDLPPRTNNGSLAGVWKFVNLNASTESTVEERDGSDIVKTVTKSSYTSEKNTGTIKFDTDTVLVNGLSYEIKTVAKSYIYDNGVLLDSLDFPFAFSVPLTNSKTKYKQIGSDSLYMEGGAVFNTTGGTATSQGQGFKIKFSGDKLIMTSNINQVKTVNIGSTIQTQQSKATSITTYQKQ
jgi:hypothetical protein